MWREDEQTEERGYTVWSPFDRDTDYFDPSTSEMMVNYRVDDVVGMVAALQAAGAQVVGEIKDEPNGKFAYVVDPDGRKLELWQPVPSAEDPYL